jgi:3,4-dihydroxy 2-butanone 4-phosphate synthase/GTP cyclohydrolase II
MFMQMAVQREVSARIPTRSGELQLCYYSNSIDEKEHLALVWGQVSGENIMTRVHSECFTGDVLGSLRCDCGEQLAVAMDMISAAGAGVILYLRQEGRGIGLLEKLKAYNLQDDGLDTVDANIELGHQPDERDYTIAALILEDLGVKSISLLTNNPAKIESLEALGISIHERIPLTPHIHPENEEYLRTKAERMNHWLGINGKRS